METKLAGCKESNHIRNLLANYEILCKSNALYKENKETVRNQILDEFETILIENSRSNMLWSPDHIEDQTVISGTVISHCNKWGVPCKVIPDKEFDYLNRLILNNKKRLLIQNDIKLRYFGIDCSPNGKKTITFSEAYTGNSSADSLALHELAHILLKVNPSIINEGSSPLYTLWYHLLKYCDADHSILHNEGKQKAILAIANLDGQGPKNISSFESYIEHFTLELKELKLIDKHCKPTFQKGNFRPKHSWLSVLGSEF